MSTQTISVVVPARGSTDSLDRCLRTLSEGSDAASVEILVVADGHPRSVREAIGRAGLADRVRLLERAHGGPAAARNTGWRAASAPIVLFLDESHVPDPGLAARHLDAHARQPGAVVVGPVKGPEGWVAPWVAYEAQARDREYARLLDGTCLRGIPVGGNFSAPVSLLDKIGGFESGRLLGEHMELGLSVADAGVPIVWEPRAVVRDVASPTLAQWRANYRLQGRFDVAAYRRPDHGGLSLLAATFHDRALLNRISIRAALRMPWARPFLTSGYALIAALAHALGLALVARAACAAISNIDYWSSVADGMRSAQTLRRLMKTTQSSSDRPYLLVGHRG